MTWPPGSTDDVSGRVVARHVEHDSPNLIHDDDTAARFGFAQALVPGVELFGLTTIPLVTAWGAGWFDGGSIALRFRRPVYEGEALDVELAGGHLQVRGPDGEVRCTGTAARRAASPALPALTPLPLPDPPTAAPAPGQLGSVEIALSAAQGRQYAEALGDPLELYSGPEPSAHPGLLLRAVNEVLMQNVSLGPWIHTASACAWLAGPVLLPTTLQVHASVTALGQRSGHDEVRYDAVVLADGRPVLQVDHTALWRLRP